MGEELSVPARPQRLLDQVRDALRHRRYSDRTEGSYVHWFGTFIFVSDKYSWWVRVKSPLLPPSDRGPGLNQPRNRSAPSV